jgi:DNA repair ATPase RecN
MEAQTQKETKPAGTEALIQTEWNTIHQLEKMLTDPELSVKEKTSIANVLAFHVNTLNKLLLQNGGQEQISEQNLGDYIRNVEPKIARHFRRDYKSWKKTLSLKKS